MASSRSDWSGAYHPEVGLLCPSPRRRRALRLATACVAATVIVGTTMGLAGTHRPDRDALAATTIVTGELEPSQAPATAAAELAPLQRGHDFCESVSAQDPVASFLHPNCSAPKARHGGRVAKRTATFLLGRTEVPR